MNTFEEFAELLHDLAYANFTIISSVPDQNKGEELTPEQRNHYNNNLESLLLEEYGDEVEFYPITVEELLYSYDAYIVLGLSRKESIQLADRLYQNDFIFGKVRFDADEEMVCLHGETKYMVQYICYEDNGWIIEDRTKYVYLIDDPEVLDSTGFYFENEESKKFNFRFDDLDDVSAYEYPYAEEHGVTVSFIIQEVLGRKRPSIDGLLTDS